MSLSPVASRNLVRCPRTVTRVSHSFCFISNSAYAFHIVVIAYGGEGKMTAHLVRRACRKLLPIRRYAYTCRVHARPRYPFRFPRLGDADAFAFALVASLVAAPDARAPGPLRHAGPAGRRAVVPCRH